MSEYRITITVADHGRRETAEDCMECLLEAFEHTHPEVGAVVGANFHLGRLDVTFSVEAEDAQQASTLAGQVFVEAAVESDLEPKEITEINVVCIGEATAQEADRELSTV